MQTVFLNGRPTSCLGFGGSLLGSTSAAHSRRLLCAAYDHGIRHFDVAPMYGFGKSERLLRDALGSRMQNVSVTSKYGLAAPSHSRWIGPTHRVARKLLSRFPAVKRRFQATTGALNAREEPPLTVSGAQAGLEHTLRELGLSTLDLLLLHEATPERLPDNGLLEFLEATKGAGKIRGFGIGSRSEYVSACLAERPAYCKLVQYEWSVFSAPNNPAGSVPRINHGSLAGQRPAFIRWLHEDSNRCRRWSHQTGVDLECDNTINRLLLKASLIHNTGHIVLFSTKSIVRVKENVETAEDDRLEVPAKILHRLVHREFLTAN